VFVDNKMCMASTENSGYHTWMLKVSCMTTRIQL